MLGNAKIWPYYMYNIKSWIFSHKVVKDFFITWMKFMGPFTVEVLLLGV